MNSLPVAVVAAADAEEVAAEVEGGQAVDFHRRQRHVQLLRLLGRALAAERLQQGPRVRRAVLLARKQRRAARGRVVAPQGQELEPSGLDRAAPVRTSPQVLGHRQDN